MHDEDILSWEELAIKAISLSKDDTLLAKQTFQKSLALNPDHSWPYIKYADIVDDYDKKKSLLQQAIDIDDNLWGYIGLINIFIHNQEQDQALKTLEILRNKIKNIKNIDDDECIRSKYLELESTLNPNQHHLLVKYGIDLSQNPTSTSDIENFWPIHHDYRNKTNKYNAIGKLYAKQYSIAIVGTITEADPKNVEYLVQQLILVGQLFKNARIALINRSINSKVEEILNNNNVSIIDHSQYIIPNNAYVDWVKKECPQSDYVLVIDLDFIQSFSINGIMNSIFWLQRIHKAAAMGSYSLGITNSIKNRLVKNIDIHSLKLEDYYNYNKDWIPSLYLKVGSKPFCVKSCFGGLILYKAGAFISGEYHSSDNQHTPFHHSLAKKNKQQYKIYLNPTSRTCNILTDNYVNINKLKILDTHRENTGLGLVNKDLHKWCLTHGHLINKFKNKDILLIAGRPDEYTLLDSFIDHYIVFWTTFESTILPPSWVSYLNKVDEVIVPHESICQNFINSGVTSQISIVEQPYQRYNTKKLRSKSNPPEKILNIGFNGLPTNRKNLVKLIQAIKIVNNSNKKYHLYIKMPYLINNSYYQYLLDSSITLDTDDFSPEQMQDWYSKLDAYIYPSSGEGWSFTPRESLYMGIPTVTTDIGVHQELLPYCCVITNNNAKELAYYEFCQAFHGEQNHYSIENIVDALNDLHSNYSKYRDLATNGSKWIRTMWTQNELYYKLLDTLEPENLIICPSQYKLCGINTYTQKLLPRMKNTKYISKIEDIIKYDLTKIKNIHVQHEWGLYDHKQLIRTIKSLPDNINKQITMHSVIRDNPEHQQEIINNFNDIFVLCSLSKNIDPKIQYIDHGANPPFDPDKNTVDLNKKSKEIGTFGFLHLNKGYQHVANALASVNYTYKIIATHKNTPESLALEQQIRSYSNVQLDTNFYTINEIYDQLKTCKALIFYYDEQKLFFTSGAILEAGRFGVPIITSDECMFTDLGNAVHRVEKNNPEAITEAIIKLQDLDYCKYLVNNMNELLQKRQWNNYAKQYN